MVAHVTTVAFLGIETRPVDVQVQMAGGLPIALGLEVQLWDAIEAKL